MRGRRRVETHHLGVVLIESEGVFVRIAPGRDLFKELYLQEKAVAMRLAQHCAAVIAVANGGNETDWNIIYDAAHVNVSKERIPGEPEKIQRDIPADIDLTEDTEDPPLG